MSKEIPLSKGMVAIVDDEDFELVSAHKWHFSVKGYAARSIWIGGRRTQFMHALIAPAPIGMLVDHRNTNKLDNRRDNLRFVDKFANQQNRGKNRNNSSGYKGVSWSRRGRAWLAQITANGTFHRLGLYQTKEQAALAYQEAAMRLHGEFARTT